jgi:hypothetical protein
MKVNGFTADIVRRSVAVRCPDKPDGVGVQLPPGDDDAWIDAATAEHAGLVGIEGPTIQGCYVFHWVGLESDGQIKYRSLRTITGLY